MKIKVGINGMGRIGRMILRAISENKYKNIEINHINNKSNTEICCNLLKHDSVHGKFNAKIDFDDHNIFINKKKFLLAKRQILKKLIGKNQTLILFLSVQENSIRKKN